MAPETFSVRRLHHVSFGTADLTRSLAFYCDLLGGKVAHQFVNDQGELYGAFVHFGNGTFIEVFNDANQASAGKSYFRHLALEVDDLEAAAAFLRANGHDPTIRRGRTDNVLQCFIEGPDGTIVELQQHDDQSALTRFLEERSTAGR